MAILTKAQLKAENSSSFPNNNSQAITPQILRDYNVDIIDTLVDSNSTASFARTDLTNEFSATNNFTSISASSFVSASAFTGDGSRLTNITASVSLPILDEGVLQGYATSMNFTGSAISAQVIAGTAVVQVNIEGAGFVTTSSFNAFTASTNQFTQSASSSISQLNASSASQQISINALNVYTASQSTASIVNSINSLNSFTQSQETFNSTISAEVTALEIATASLFTSVTNLNASSASQQISINALNANSASLNSKTGSYATTGSNSFDGNQNITGSLTVTDGATSLQVGTSGDIISLNAGGSNINFTFGGDAAFAGDAITLRNASGEPSFTLYNGTGVGQKVYGAKVTVSGASGSYVISDIQNSKDYITLGGAGENVVIGSPLNVSGNLTASLQQGYVWVGNASGITNAVATSSLQTNVSGFVTTSSFNSYTSSNDQRVSSLEVNSASVNTSITNINSTTASLNTSVSALNTFTASQSTASLVTSITELNTFSASALISISNLNTNSASVNTSVTNLNSATASLFGSASLSLYTASAVGNTITFTKGDASTFNVSVVASPIDTGSFATTASFNTYTQSNDQRVSSLEANSASVNISITNLNSATASLFTSASLAITTASFDTGTRNLTFTKGDTTTFAVNIPDVSGSVGGFATLGANTFTGSQTISSSLNVSGSANFVGGDVNFTDQGRNINIDVDRTIIKGQKPTLISSSLDIQGSLTASLTNGYAWVGDATNHNVLVATSSFATNVSNLATTGSNSFNGNQIITGSVYISSSATVDLRVEGQIFVSSSATGGTTAPKITVSGSAGTSTINRNSISTRNLTNQASLNPQAIYATNLTTSDEIGFSVDSAAFPNWSFGPGIYVNNTTDTYPAIFGFQNKANYTDGRITALNNLIVSGNIDIQNTLTASLQQGYVWVGNASNRTTLVATSSFGGGGAAFPYTGSAEITGSLGITGSLNGFVNTLSISSNTASLDFNNGNFFTLQLVSGSITHLTGTNIKAGQTINLLVKMASGSAAASGSLTFSPTFKFAGGFDYTPTAITASQDLVSFVTFDTTQIFAAQVKNLS
jgi:uncharacterized coiled-coil protein SlyX